jgi:hypothetical protein
MYQMNQWVDRVRDANGNIIVPGTPWTGRFSSLS